MEKDRKKQLKCFKYFQIQWLIPVFIIGLELLFHVEIYGHFDFNMVHAILFSLPFSFLALLVGSTGSRIWNGIARCIMLLAAVVYFTAQIIYYQVFGNFLSLKSIFNGAGQAVDFSSTIWEAFLEHALVIGVAVLCYIGHVVLEINFYKKENRELGENVRDTDKTEVIDNDGNADVFGAVIAKAENKRSKYEKIGENKYSKKLTLVKTGIYLMLIFVIPFLGTMVLMAEGTGISSAYVIKTRFHRTEQSMYRLGLMETLAKDLEEKFCDMAGITESQWNAGYLWIEKHLFKENVDKIETAVVWKERDTDGTDSAGRKNVETGEKSSDGNGSDKKTEKTKVLYHKWDIDFDALKKNTTDMELQEMHTYFAGVEPTAENIYTGLFEGYNLIYITAESFSDVVIDEERTPVLYRMWQEGFQFQNFYTPSWYLSTIDGEYVNCLGQIPVDGDWSMEHSAGNALPMALGNQLAGKGYTCNAYHNHDSYYYDRTKTHPKLGYTFKAVGAGLTFESMYPESDLELMEITCDEYLNKSPFHTYYVTMSGHLPYTYGYNSMAVKNRQLVEDMGLSENAACYLAANTELEYGVKYLIEKLEQAGQLSHTLFVIAPDHYPYGLKKGAYDELHGQAVEEDAFEIYRNTCLIWSASMKETEGIEFPVKVEKYGSNLDLLPTISNLMGLSYDSRLLAGRDLLSEDMGLVMFKDHSFLTDKVRYNAMTGEAVWAQGVKEDPAYLEKCMQEVQDRFYYSAQILGKDYMSVIKEQKN